ncbi:MAG: hypothetical protein JSS61_00375 [Verrucomicrobia bacterium]|nr:hypothetical protein [Verrucomicrobiota bacterium]
MKKMRAVLAIPLVACASLQSADPQESYNTLARYGLKRHANLFLEADFLYWKACDEGMAYAVKDHQGPGDYYVPPGASGYAYPYNFAPGHNAHVANARYDWNVGARVGLGYNFAGDGWDMLFNWTYYSTNGNSKRGINPTTQTLFTVLGQNALVVNADSAKAHRKLTYNTLDWELGRNFWVGNHFSLHPHLGLRGAWIEQKFDVNYYNVSFLEQVSLGPTVIYVTPRERIDNTNRYLAVGPRIGFGSDWDFGRHWSLFGELAASLLWSYFHVTTHETFVPMTGGKENLTDARDNTHAVTANLDLALGLRYDINFDKDRHHLGVTLGWEYLFWFNQTRFNKFGSSDMTGRIYKDHVDLGLTGVTLSARYDF